MKEGKGKVSRIFHNETKGGKPYWVVAIQTGPNKYERLSTFDFNTLSGISEGDTISYKADQNGKYTNILEVTKTDRGSAGTSGMPEYQGGGGVAEIGRMSALKSAAQLLVDFKGDPDEKVKRTLAAAKEFEAYIFGSKEEASDGTKPE
jgi:hypothetical protein